MQLDGIHHITAITADAQRNVDFYARVLGLRLVKKSVNQDDPTVYHLFYGDEHAHPGLDLTFFEYPGAAAGCTCTTPRPMAAASRAPAPCTTWPGPPRTTSTRRGASACSRAAAGRP